MKWFKRTAEGSVRFCREAAIDYSPGRLRYATARPGVGTLTAYPQSRDVGRAESGLQPWVRQTETRACLSAVVLGKWDEGGKVAPDVTVTGWVNTPCPEHARRSPLSGGFIASPHPGLKPWAILFNRFAVKSDGQPGSKVFLRLGCFCWIISWSKTAARIGNTSNHRLE